MVDKGGPSGGGGSSSKEAAVTGVPGCPECGGQGGWEDPVAQMTVLCPMCRAFTAEHYAMAKFKMYSWVPAAFPQVAARYPGPVFSQEPWLLVIHSGDKCEHVAEYMANPGDDRKVSCHVSYSRTHRDYAQQVPFNRAAWHVGGAQMVVKKKRIGRLNYCSIGIERPGPPGKKSDAHELLFVTAIEKILQYNPSLKMVAKHSDIDQNRADPGIDIGFLSEYGLEVYGV